MLSRACRISVVAIGLLVASTQAGLKEYVQTPDPVYKYEVVQEGPMPMMGTVYILRMVSLKWQGIQWEHQMLILVPNNVRNPQTAIMLIDGGSTKSGTPNLKSQEARALSAVGAQLGTPVVVLRQVPNQPLFNNLYEDAIVAKSFQEFIKGNGDDWPLLLPMTKSAVRGMDTAVDFLKNKAGIQVKEFIVTGASKRGWTTWLTAAADDRVKAIAPMVIDVLNMAPQMDQQVKSYGDFSMKISDYSNLNLMAHLNTPPGKRLTDLVDPYSYREKFTMPKLILLGTNDPYWTVDAANLYIDDLKGDTYLHYEPNAGHGLGMGIVGTMTAFIRSMVDGTPLPEVKWQRGTDGLTVSWDRPDAKAYLWSAHSPTRDFRKAKWQATPLVGTGSATATIKAPANGWTAYFVQVRFPDTVPFSLSTAMTVVPETFPHDLNDK